MVSDLLGAVAFATAGMMMATRAVTVAVAMTPTFIHLITLLYSFRQCHLLTHSSRQHTLSPVLFPATTKPIDVTSTANMIQEVVMLAMRP
jgi:hypothetical protein